MTSFRTFDTIGMEETHMDREISAPVWGTLPP